MSKLTLGDINTLTTFFASPLTRTMGLGLAAQSYEPKGKGYDPATDTRLATLVFVGVRHGKNEWAQMKRIVDQLSDAYVEVLRLMCHGGRMRVACHLPRAIEAGRRLAAEAQRTDCLEAELRHAREQGLSPMACAGRVLEADRTFVFSDEQVTTLRLMSYARDAIDDGLVDVEAETDALIDEVAEAYHRAVALAAEWRRAAVRREDQRRASFRAELDERKATKERARFERRLRAAS